MKKQTASKKPGAKNVASKDVELNQIFFSLGFWGSTARGILLAVVVLAVVLLANMITLLPNFWANFGAAILAAVMFLIYDALYVGAARALPMSRTTDKCVLFASELIFIIAIFCVGGGVAPGWIVRFVAFAPILAVGILLIRLVVGVMSSRNKNIRS